MSDVVILRDIVTDTIYTQTSDDYEGFMDDFVRPYDLCAVQIIYVDGSGWNGILSAICYGTKDNLKIKSYPFQRTNNEMEYDAIINGCLIANDYDIIYSDSQLAVLQILGKYSVKEQRLLPLREKAKKLIDDKHLLIKWIPRHENHAGILLDKRKLR